MNLALDAQTEQRIQRELDRGQYREPVEVINRALDLLEADQSWSENEKADLDRRYGEGMAACNRGEGISGDNVRESLPPPRHSGSRSVLRGILSP